MPTCWHNPSAWLRGSIQATCWQVFLFNVKAMCAVRGGLGVRLASSLVNLLCMVKCDIMMANGVYLSPFHHCVPRCEENE